MRVLKTTITLTGFDTFQGNQLSVPLSYLRVAAMDPSFLYNMTTANALPSKYSRYLAPQTGSMISGSPMVSSPKFIQILDVRAFDKVEWFALPKALTDVLGTLPWEQILGQGVLIRDTEGHTALVSIAEGACLQQSNFPRLLQCLLHAIESATDLIGDGNEGGCVQYDVSWRYKNYLPSSTKMFICTTADDGWVMGLVNDSDVIHWLALEVLFTLEWIRNILLPPPSATLYLVERPRLSFDRERKDFELRGTEPSIRVNANQLAPMNGKIDEGGDGCWRQKSRVELSLHPTRHPMEHTRHRNLLNNMFLNFFPIA